jgi:hypothetical protein
MSLRQSPETVETSISVIARSSECAARGGEAAGGRITEDVSTRLTLR